MRPNLEPGPGGDRACKRGRVRFAIALISVALAAPWPALALSAPAVMAASPVGTVTNYTNPGIKSPFRIALGSDGAMWYTNPGNNSIGRISPDGTVTNYDRGGINWPTDIVAGPDGALWFTNRGNKSIGRITTAGAVTNYTDPNGGIAEPYSITLGPDHALWFTNTSGEGSIGRIDPATGDVSTYPTPTNVIPGDIATGPDDALWFTEPMTDGYTIGRFSITTGDFSFYSSETLNGPEEIVAGPGGLWFTQDDATIGRITTGGVVTTYPSGSGTPPIGIAAGPDGNLWFTFPGENSIGRITAGGTATVYTGTGSNPQGIAAGSDGNMWFTSNGNNRIGRIATDGTDIHTYGGVGISDPHAIALASDGALWFTDHDNNSLGRVTTGGFVTTITDPGISQPYDIVAAPDGALWFTNQGNSTIGRLDLTTGIVSNYTGGYLGNWISMPLDITVGPDGALWFTASHPGLGSITRMNLSGEVTARYIGNSATYDINGPKDLVAADGAVWFVNMTSFGRVTPDGTVSHWYPDNAFVTGITAGPDGALWFTTMIGDRIERISTDVDLLPSGTSLHSSDLQDEYVGTGISGSYAITTGPDGALWFTNNDNHSIGRITTSGVVSNYTGTGINTPKGITAGPDGALWFVNPGNNSIGRIESGTEAPAPSAPSAPTMGTPSAGNGEVTLSWTAPASDGGSAITGYNVYQGTSSGNEEATPVATLGGSATGTTIGSLTNGTTYWFTVKAINAVGDGAASNEVSATPAALLTGTLSITEPTSGRYGQSAPITVSGSSGTGALSFDAGSSTACEIDGGNVVISAGSGSCTITATRASDGIYASTTSDPFTVTVDKAPLTATAVDKTITYGDPTPGFGVVYSDFVGSDTALSLGGTLGYTFAGISPTVYASSSTAPIHAGTYSITPSGLTGDNYAISYAAGTYTINAVSVNTTLSSGGITPNPATVGQPVSFPGVLAKPYVAGQSSTISDTNLTVQLRTWGDATCSFGSGFNVQDKQAIDATGHVTLHYTPPSAGTYHVSLFFLPQTSGDSYYGQSSSACLALTVNPAKLDQTISFAEPTDVHYGDANSDLGATATSGLAVSYASSTPSVCTIVSGKLHVVAAGSCTITASQVGSTAYNAAPDVAHTFTIEKAAQATLTITAPTGATYGAADAAITADGGSGTGAVAFDSSTPTVCSIVSGKLHVGSGSGTCSITATKAADDNYAPTTSAGFDVTVAKATAVFTFDLSTLAAKTFLDSPFSVATYAAKTASDTGPITFALGAASVGCTVSSAGLVTIIGAALDPSHCLIAASLASDANYLAAGPISQSFNIHKAAQATVTITGPSSATYGDANATITADGGSGTGAVTFSSSTTAVCTIVDGKLHVVSGTGSCSITATKAADANYNSTTSAAYPVTIHKAAQATLTITAPTDATYGDADATIITSGGSGVGAVTFDAGTSTACSIVSGNLHVISGTGTCSITATRAADTNYGATTSVAFDVTVAKATATVVYSGETYKLLASGQTNVAMTLTANVSPTICRPALFTVTASDGTKPQAESGSTFTLAAGMYDIVAAVTNPNCTAASDEAVLAVVSPADAANGGGWYKATTIQGGSPRVNLGFTIQKTTKSIKGSTNVTVNYKGGLLWLNNGQWRLKATISTTTVTTATGAFVSGDRLPYGTAPCPTAFISTLSAGSTPKCGSFTGKGTLERWDSTANGGLGGWVASTTYGATVTFTATIYDGGQVKVCTKKSCTTTDNPDWFGIQFDPVPSSVIRESAPVPLSGGALKAS